jgi:hypothetical protein
MKGNTDMKRIKSVKGLTAFQKLYMKLFIIICPLLTFISNMSMNTNIKKSLISVVIAFTSVPMILAIMFVYNNIKAILSGKSK